MVVDFPVHMYTDAPLGVLARGVLPIPHCFPACFCTLNVGADVGNCTALCAYSIFYSFSFIFQAVKRQLSGGVYSVFCEKMNCKKKCGT